MKLDANYVEPDVKIYCILSYPNDKEQEFYLSIPPSELFDKEFVKEWYFEDEVVNEGCFKASMFYNREEQDKELKNYELPDWFKECNGILFWEQNISYSDMLRNQNVDTMRGDVIKENIS